jgi:D-sedoheptulose 7-phosphate isomerase
MRDLLARQVADHLETARTVESLLPSVEDIGRQLCQAFENGKKLYTFGNGGSAADAQHLVAELIGRYRRERRPLPAVALTVDPSVVTCIGNDYTFEEIFARQVTALAGPGDVVAGFTTSGRSANVVKGLEAARTAGATTILFAAGDGGEAVQHADLALLVPSMTTARTQEMHLFLLHLVSEWVDAWAAGEVDEDGNYLGAAAVS